MSAGSHKGSAELKLSVFQLAWLLRKGALNLPLTVQFVPEVFRAGLGFGIDGSTPQPVSAADSEEC